MTTARIVEDLDRCFGRVETKIGKSPELATASTGPKRASTSHPGKGAMTG
jgi:hypothetical protein